MIICIAKGGVSSLISEHDTLYFSENGERLFFGMTPKPELPDTTLLEEEIVNVEVWNYKDPRLHTQQNIELKKDQKKAYRCWLNTKSNNPLATKKLQSLDEIKHEVLYLNLKKRII